MTRETAPDELELLSQEVAYAGFFRILRLTLRHRRPDGSWTEPYRREVFERGHAVAVLPYDLARDRVVLIEQLRPPLLLTDVAPRQVEIVAGIIEAGQTAEAVARRELREETGLVAQALGPLFRHLPSPGGSSETIQVFLALVDAAEAGGHHGLAEEHEDIRAFALPAEEAFGWLGEGRILNATAIMALQWLQLNHAGLLRAGGLQGLALPR